MSTVPKSGLPGTLDVEAMKTFLDGPRGWVRDRVREVLEREDFGPPDGLSRAEHRERVFELAKILTQEESGATGLGFPSEYGGRDDTAGYVSSFETLAFGDLSLLVKCGVHFGLFGGAIHQLGTERHHTTYLERVISLELPGCFCMTEAGHGSNVQAVRTTASYDVGTEEFIVNTPDDWARKDYIGNAGQHARVAAVFAQLVTGGTSFGVHCFVVPLRDENGEPLEGIRIEDCGAKVGLNGVDNGHVWFDRVRIPRENLLNRFAEVQPDGRYESPIENENARFFTQIGTLIQGRVSVGGAGISASKTALTIAVRYGETRRQFGPPDSDEEVAINDYLAHQRLLIPLLAKSYALSFAQRELVEELDRVLSQDDPDPETRKKLESQAAGMKAISTWHATRTIQTCREACGGEGYMTINRLAALKADTDVFTTFEGDNTVLMQLVAKGLLTDYRDEFGDLGPVGMARFVTELTFETVMERISARQVLESVVDVVSPDSDEELLESSYQLDLFRYREHHLIETVGRRLKAGIDNDEDPFDVFNRCQDHVLEAAHAHVERMVLEAFLAAIADSDDDEQARMLALLCSMYAMSTIESNRGWYLEHGRISAERSKAVIAMVNGLCTALRPHIAGLVDAFGVPEQWLAPIALDPSSPGH